MLPTWTWPMVEAEEDVAEEDNPGIWIHPAW
jgi:hypothetical protein